MVWDHAIAGEATETLIQRLACERAREDESADRVEKSDPFPH